MWTSCEAVVTEGSMPFNWRNQYLNITTSWKYQQQRRSGCGQILDYSRFGQRLCWQIWWDMLLRLSIHTSSRSSIAYTLGHFFCQVGCLQIEFLNDLRNHKTGKPTKKRLLAWRLAIRSVSTYCFRRQEKRFERGPHSARSFARSQPR